MRRRALSAIIAMAAVPAAAQAPAQQPAMAPEQAIQLFAEAGFPIAEGVPVNRCGKPSNPRVAFIDLNGDRRAEAHIADVDPACYGKPGDTLRLDIDPKSHPAWTGVQRLVDTGGQVAKFNKKFAGIGMRKK